MYIKDFDAWNILKKSLNERLNTPFANQRDIWWCHFGINIGTEEDGKHELFERPILVIKIFNKTMIRAVPLTSTPRKDTNHIPIFYNNRSGSAVLSQLKTISTKRLSRKIGRLDKEQFQKIIEYAKATF